MSTKPRSIPRAPRGCGTESCAPAEVVGRFPGAIPGAPQGSALCDLHLWKSWSFKMAWFAKVAWGFGFFWLRKNTRSAKTCKINLCWLNIHHRGLNPLITFFNYQHLSILSGLDLRSSVLIHSFTLERHGERHGKTRIWLAKLVPRRKLILQVLHMNY